MLNISTASLPTPKASTNLVADVEIATERLMMHNGHLHYVPLGDEPVPSVEVAYELTMFNEHPVTTIQGNTIASYQRRVDALFNIWVFFDLIKYRGGLANFMPVHRRMIAFETEGQNHVCSGPDDNEGFEVFTANSRRIKICARGHLKSTISVGVTLWRLYRNPNWRLSIGTSIKELGEAFLSDIRQHLEDPTLIDTVWNQRPHIPGPLVPKIPVNLKMSDKVRRRFTGQINELMQAWNSLSIEVIRPNKYKEGTVELIPGRTARTGKHCNALLMDDLIDWESARPADSAEKTQRWVSDANAIVDPPEWMWLNRDFKFMYKGNAYTGFGEWVGDEYVINGTFFIEHDWYKLKLFSINKDTGEYLYKEKGYKLLMFNVYGYADEELQCPDEGEPLWPEKFTPKYIESKRRNMSEKDFAAQFLLKIVSGDANDFNVDKMNVLHPFQVTISPETRMFCVRFDGFQNTEMWMSPIIVVDPAGGKKGGTREQQKQRNHTSIGVGSRDEFNRVVLLAQTTGQLQTQEAWDVIDKYAAHYGAYKAYIEADTGLSQAFIDYGAQLPRETPISIETVTPKGNKYINNLAAITPILNEGLLYVATTVKPAISHLLRLYPDVQYDDMVDMLRLLILCAPRYATNGARMERIKQARPKYRINDTYGGLDYD